ncbi:MAG: hypothetical protein LAP38_10935 [Acidobacteriia bacterium]|nr:hypothetical protein [Terriglobia bacterium]
MVRHQFAVIALLAIALASSFWVLLDVAGDYSKRSASFGVASFESRFSELRKTVTPQSVFGYTSDNPPNDPSDQAEFYLTQYTLAPAIVTSSTLEKLVIANFHNPNPDLNVLQAKHLTPVQNFGNGIILCRPSAAQ